MTRIIALHWDDCQMALYAVRSDGARLRLKKQPPAYVRKTGVARGIMGPIEHTYWLYSPVEAVNQWLGFS